METKYETIMFEVKTTESTLQQFIQLIPMSSNSLGALLVRAKNMDCCLVKRCEDFERAISRLCFVSAHDPKLFASFFRAPKPHHILRAALCHDHRSLAQFDDLICSMQHIIRKQACPYVLMVKVFVMCFH